MLRLMTVGVLALVFTNPAAAQDVYRVSERVTAPRIVELAKPRYSSTAQLKQIHGVVALEVDVLPDGTVTTVALVTSLDPEVDGIAAEVARNSRFMPGTKDGKLVAVRIAMDLEFDMRASAVTPMRLLEGPAPNSK